MSDLIDRQAAIDVCTKAKVGAFPHDAGINNSIKALKALPSAQPERKKGRWIDDGKGFYMCSSCGKTWEHWWARVMPPNRMCKELEYCPKCGADMRGESDE